MREQRIGPKRRRLTKQDFKLAEPNILALQGELAQAQVRQAELTRASSLAEDHYLSLASKIDEAKIAARESANFIQIASSAVVPTERVGTRLLLSAFTRAFKRLILRAAVFFLKMFLVTPEFNSDSAVRRAFIASA